MCLTLQRRRGLCLGLLYLRRWTNKRRTARLAMWRAGIWAGTSNAIYILKRWRRNVTRDREIRLCVRIAERRRDAVQSKMKHRHGFSLKRHVFTILRTHALDRNLARRIFKAWSSHSQSSRHVQRQVKIPLQNVNMEIAFYRNKTLCRRSNARTLCSRIFNAPYRSPYVLNKIRISDARRLNTSVFA